MQAVSVERASPGPKQQSFLHGCADIRAAFVKSEKLKGDTALWNGTRFVSPATAQVLFSLRPNNTFPVFATYLIPPASPPPLRGGAKSASNPFARARKPHTWFFSLSGSVALPGFTLMPARSGFAWQPQMLSWHLLRRLVLCHRSPTWFRMLTAHRFLFYFSLVCLPVALQVSILAAQLDVAEGGAPHSQSARVPLSSSSASSC